MFWNRPTLVIIATYNERQTLPRLVDQLEQRFPRLDLLVVDDRSPDGTGTWCDGYAARHGRFHVLHRRGPRGLGVATIDGFQWGLDRDYEYLVTMDADLSHDPNDLERMFDRMAQDSTGELGLVVGSRYVSGGSIEGWPRRRHWASRFVNRYAQLAIGLPTKDSTSAFRLYRAESLKKIDLERIDSRGFAYLEEILWRLDRARVAIAEVPITFRDRREGASKVRLGVMASAGWQLIRLTLWHRLGLGR